MRILLIEDDRLIGDGIAVGLGKMGFTIDWFKNGIDGKEALYSTDYEAVILDLGLPGQDGLTILKEWRAKKRNELVLILTAMGEVEQKVLGLNSGADDYLAKPFSLSEVAARLRALIRRNHSAPNPVLTHRGVCFDPHTKSVTLSGVNVELAPKEIMLLELFLLNKNIVLSKEIIEEKLYSWDEDVQSNTVEVHVHHLRRKLGQDFIRTVHKLGYILDK